MRPRIEGFEEQVINSFLDRGIFKNEVEVIRAALALLVDERIKFESEQETQANFDTEIATSQYAIAGE